MDAAHASFEHASSTEIGAARGAAIGLSVIAAVAGLLWCGIHLSHREEDRRAEARRQIAYLAIKEGRGGEITVSDGQLVAMLAADPDCIENCTTLVFTDVDFSDEGFEHLRELAHLVDVGVYSSENIDLMFEHLQGSPALEKLWIESTPVSDDGIGLITTLPRLEFLHFEQAMPVQQISYLKTALPRLKLGYLTADRHDSGEE
jgi:threonine dehydrogenase-like Zn-dependent dehydrogenase